MTLRAGVVGIGHLGRHHARIYGGLEGVELSAVSDTDAQRRFETALRTGARAFARSEDMIGRVDLVSIVVPTSYHLAVARPFIEAGVHVLIEKPLAPTVEEAREICALADKHGVVLQVGHIERFNPAIEMATQVIRDPRYIVADRIAPYTFRSGDIGVVLDLMVHDLDVILQFVRSPIASVEAVGLPVMSSWEDIADARLRFTNGALADVKTSRVSFASRMRKIRFFQHDAYVSIDYNDRKVWVYRKKSMNFDASQVDPHSVSDPLQLILDRYVEVQEHAMVGRSDALTAELRSFVSACRGEHGPVVSGQEGLRAVEAARVIQGEIQRYLLSEAKRQGLELPDFISQSRFGDPGDVEAFQKESEG